MRWIIAVSLCASLAAGQDGADAPQPRYRKQGAAALAKEQGRSKAKLCADADTLKGGNARIGQCLTDQGKQTEEDYRAYIRAIGGLLRLSSAEESAQPLPKRLPFDSAEDTWQSYRDKSCTSMATQWQGGDQATVAYSDCRLRLTWNHMNELADLYSDLWDGRATSPGQPGGSVPEALTAAIAEVKAKSRIALLLPSELSPPIADAEHAIVDTATDDRYAILLYYDLGVGNAGFAASFSAYAHAKYRPKDLPNVEEVKLSSGLVGYFRPVSCGGSCAPANLWWEENQILYQFQFKVSSALSENDQQRVIIAAANSAILAGPR